MIDKFVQGPDLIGAVIIKVDGTLDEYYTLTIKLKTGVIAEVDAEHGTTLLGFTIKEKTENSGDKQEQ